MITSILHPVTATGAAVALCPCAWPCEDAAARC